VPSDSWQKTACASCFSWGSSTATDCGAHRHESSPGPSRVLDFVAFPCRELDVGDGVTNVRVSRGWFLDAPTRQAIPPSTRSSDHPLTPDINMLNTDDTTIIVVEHISNLTSSNKRRHSIGTHPTTSKGFREDVDDQHHFAASSLALRAFHA